MKKWYDNHNDRFPGEWYCYILAEWINGLMIIYDERRSNIPLDLNKEVVECISMLGVTVSTERL